MRNLWLAGIISAIGFVPAVPDPAAAAVAAGLPVWMIPPVIVGVIAAWKGLLWIILLMVLASFIASAWLTAAMFPGVVSRLAEVCERAPMAAFGVGLLAWLALAPLAVLLAVSLVGWVLLLWIPLALLVAIQFGTTGIALLIGRRIHHATIAVEALVGAAALSVASAFPHLGWLLMSALGTWGLGVVILAIVEWTTSRQVKPPAPPAPATGV